MKDGEVVGMDRRRLGNDLGMVVWKGMEWRGGEGLCMSRRSSCICNHTVFAPRTFNTCASRESRENLYVRLVCWDRIGGFGGFYTSCVV